MSSLNALGEIKGETWHLNAASPLLFQIKSAETLRAHSPIMRKAETCDVKHEKLLAFRYGSVTLISKTNTGTADVMITRHRHWKQNVRTLHSWKWHHGTSTCVRRVRKLKRAPRDYVTLTLTNATVQFQSQWDEWAELLFVPHTLCFATQPWRRGQTNNT